MTTSGQLVGVLLSAWPVRGEGNSLGTGPEARTGLFQRRARCLGWREAGAGTGPDS